MPRLLLKPIFRCEKYPCFIENIHLRSWLGIIFIFIKKESWCIELSEQLASWDKKPRWQFLRLQAEGDITFGSKEPSPSLFKAGSKTYYFVYFFSFLGGRGSSNKIWLQQSPSISKCCLKRKALKSSCMWTSCCCNSQSFTNNVKSNYY